MKLMQVIAGVVVTAGTVVAINTATAGATGSTACDVPKLKLGESTGQNMVEKSGKITATFTVTGKNCTTPVTLAVWESPSADGQPINEQKLYTHATKTYSPGTHKITADLPDCYWQADLLVGDKATAPDGTANYAYQNGQILSVHPLRDFKFGGDKKCEKPEEPKDVCPNIDGTQTEVPAGHSVDGEGNCFVPETPEQPQTPEVKGVQAPAPEALPSTGAGTIAATFLGVSTSAGLAHAIVRRIRTFLE